MTAPDATPAVGPGDPAGQVAPGDGSAAVADFTGLDSDDRAAAPVATFDDLDQAGNTSHVRPDLLGRDTADGHGAGGADESDGGDGGSPTVRVADFDGPHPSPGRSSRSRPARAPISARRAAVADGRTAGVRESGGHTAGAREPDGHAQSAREPAGAPEIAAEPDADGVAGPGPRARPGGAGSRSERRATRSGGPSGAGRGGLSFSPQDDEARAKEICLRLLTDRARTVQELSQALRRKEIPDDVARRVLERFDEVGLVDDEAFAGQWVRSRHRQRGLGRRAIAAELHRKGVAKEIADEALTEIDAESEQARARELVDRKLRTVPIATTEQRLTAARRLVGMLARKGYGATVAYRVVREAITARGAGQDDLGEDPID